MFFPGLRLGYLVLPDALVDHFVAAKWVADRGCSTIDQAALAECIESGVFEKHMRHTARQLAARRTALLQPLVEAFGDSVRIGGSAAGMHMVLWLPTLDAAAMGELVTAAAERGVGIYPLAPYYLSAPPPAGLLLGYACLDLDQITAGATELVAALRPYLGG